MPIEQATSVEELKKCLYCGQTAHLATGLELYPFRRSVWKKYFWRCDSCDAHVGCHPDSDIPLGRPSKKELRRTKILLHTTFDRFWKSGRMTRDEAYEWLAGALGIPREQTHIGYFDEEMCKRVLLLCRSKALSQGMPTEEL